jgi:hypothetical protein
MDFASFTCVLVLDTTLGRKDELTLERLAEVKRLAGSSSLTNFSINHFDADLEATTLLSVSKSRAANGVGRDA